MRPVLEYACPLPSLALEPDGCTIGVARVVSETSNANNPPADRLPVGDDSGRHGSTARSPRIPLTQILYPQRFGLRLLPPLSSPRTTRPRNHQQTPTSQDLRNSTDKNWTFSKLIYTLLFSKLPVTARQTVNKLWQIKSNQIKSILYCLMCAELFLVITKLTDNDFVFRVFFLNYYLTFNTFNTSISFCLRPCRSTQRPLSVLCSVCLAPPAHYQCHPVSFPARSWCPAHSL